MVLVKEYRIPLPVSVEEYKIAQRFMVAKVSKQHTSNGEGIEILESKPYHNADDNSSGTYTHKLIHIGSKVPGWLSALMPATALQVEEKAWNAFPYCKTVYSCPFLGDRFSISVETRYLADNGSTENALKLSPQQLKDRQVDLIDIAFDPLDPSKYKEEEDPTIFESKKTGRGKLQKDWLKTTDPIMTCYKNAEVEFRYWGFQTKVEQFIHKLALRDVMLHGHRQAFCWIDEWFGLTWEEVMAIEERSKAELDALREGAAHHNDADPEDDFEEADGASPPKKRSSKSAASPLKGSPAPSPKLDSPQLSSPISEVD